jgi:hypothetical protein
MRSNIDRTAVFSGDPGVGALVGSSRIVALLRGIFAPIIADRDAIRVSCPRLSVGSTS